MGMCSSESTTTVETGELSERGETLNALFTELMLENLKEYGNYDITPKTTTKYADEGKAGSLQEQIASLDTDIAKLQDSAASTPASTDSKNRGTAAGSSSDAQIYNLTQQKIKLQNELNGIPQTTFTEYDLQKKEDPRVLDAIEKYGEAAPEVTQMRESIKSEELDRVNSIAEVNKNYLNNLVKLSKGDYSYTQEQADQIDKYIAPVKDLIYSTSQDLLDKYGQSDALLRSELDNLYTEIDKTGFAISDALEAASVQYEKSGSTLFDTLKGVNDSNYTRAKFEFDLLSEKADQKSAQQAAMLGLPPGSEAEKVAAAKIKSDALSQIQLELNVREAQGALGIQQFVEEGKTKISLSKVALEEAQGGKKEGVAKQIFDVAAMTSAKEESAIGARGNALIGLENQNQSMLQNAAFGGLPSLLQGSAAGLSFDQGQQVAGMNMNSTLMNPVGQQLSVEQQRQFAETTTNSKQSKSFLDAFTDIIGAGSSIAGAAMSFGGGGGGGSSPTSYAPASSSSLSTYYPTAQPSSPFHFEY